VRENNYDNAKRARTIYCEFTFQIREYRRNKKHSIQAFKLNRTDGLKMTNYIMSIICNLCVNI